MREWITTKVGKKDTINIVVVNGIGTGFGDNFVGLGAMQRLTNLLAPTRIIFHLMQTMDVRSKPIYMHLPNVFLKNNCMPMNDFFSMDLMINLTGMLGFPDFNKLALAHFHNKMFSINQLTPTKSLHPKLTLNKAKVNAITTKIADTLDNSRKTVLIHPQASSPVRTMPPAKALSITKQLISSGFNVVFAFPSKQDFKSKHFADLSKISRSIDDLNHIIAACDAVISVGTVVYHLAAAQSKPTFLLPTVRADVESAELSPEVISWLPKKSEALIIDKHKSREEEDLKIAKKIWNNINAKNLASDFKKHISSFTQLATPNKVKAPSAPALVGVVIPQFGDQSKLTRCLDSLVKVHGFDPAYLYVIDNNKNNRYFTVAVNQGIELALRDGCEYVWVLNNDTEVDSNYINASLKRFKQNKKIGIVGGKNLKTEKPDRIFWGGSYNAFPTGQHKAGYVSKGDLNKATRESWATFSSVIIRAQTYLDTGGLDNSMRMIFSDSDFCFSAAQKGWQTWYEPNAIVTHDTGVSARGGNKTLRAIFKQDKIEFWKKWKKITDCERPEELQEAILKSINYK